MRLHLPYRAYFSRLQHSWRRISHFVASLVIIGSTTLSPLAQGQTPTPGVTATQSVQQAAQLLAQLTPEERVGQLFLVTYQGTDLSEESSISKLIADYHIGGVMLKVTNDNFASPGQAVAMDAGEFYKQNRQLQQITWNKSGRQGSTGDPFIPLFIGLTQDGDSFSFEQILQGITPLANAMALGATWDTELTAQTASILGAELSKLGVNLLIGPSLDVLESPKIETASNLGTRSFGGDPYWVARLGAAYIRGVHQGSNGRVAVVAKHFPGHGSSDRLPEDEVATVRKSLEELRSFDLAPFFSVTGLATSVEETTDALLVSHIRYQGLQGNIRSTTRPVSFDPQAFSLLMNLPALNTWRENGGVMVSDDLGSMAVRRFYELTSQTFDARRAALNAFLSGNDLLYIGDFTGADETDPFTATTRTLEFFVQKYREDSAFAQRVDQSVTRILALKFRLYNNFSLTNIQPLAAGLEEVGVSTSVTFEAARQAATLVSPTQEEIDETIPDPPNQNDRIVFITDVKYKKACSLCEEIAEIEKDDFQEAVVKLYGPQSGGQVTPNNLSSFTLGELDGMLDGAQTSQPVENTLKQANWIIFAMLEAGDIQKSFQTLERFLTERPDLFQQKRLLVFSFSAPYYLDATNISKLTALYALYSKTPQFVDIAAYLLFGELRPSGASPVSIPGIGYDLNEALFPDPARTIPLELDIPRSEQPTSEITPSPIPVPEYHIGDIIPLRTGVIQDHNGNPVPDGTPVTFVFTSGVESSSIRQQEITQNGIAKTSFSISNPGVLEVHAESENALSGMLRFDIPSPQNNGVPAPATEQPSPTPEPSATPTLAPQIAPVSTPQPEPPAQPEFADWIIAVLVALGISWSVYRLMTLVGQMRWGIRFGFLTFAGGLLAYSYLALGFPGSQTWLDGSVARAVLVCTILGCFLGILAGFIWKAISNRSKNTPATAGSDSSQGV